MSITEKEVAPTEKYTTYLQEVEQALAGKLKKGERRRLEGEMELLQRARFVELNGIVHHYQDVGPRDGEPLILVHGWDCSSFWWHHAVDPLKEAGYRVIIYDLKGHGFSDNDPKGDYTVTSFSADLHALIETLGLTYHHVGAFSFGAVVALDYVATWPKYVQSVVFFNFGVLTDNPIQVAVLPALLDFVFNKVLRPIERRGLWFIPYVYSRLVLAKNTPLISDVRLGTLSLRCCDPEAVRVSARQLVNREVQQAIPRQMASLTQPTLLVTGEGDPLMIPRRGRDLMDLARDGIFMEIPRCGHLILFELPELVVQIMRQHLRAAGNRQKK